MPVKLCQDPTLGLGLVNNILMSKTVQPIINMEIRVNIKTMVIYLGIESSCDETAAAVVADGRGIYFPIVLSRRWTA